MEPIGKVFSTDGCICPSCLIRWAFTSRQKRDILCPLCSVPLVEERA